jgi:hypothetical protein
MTYTLTWVEHYLIFYERNPVGRGLDFPNNLDYKKDFLQ